MRNPGPTTVSILTALLFVAACAPAPPAPTAAPARPAESKPAAPPAAPAEAAKPAAPAPTVQPQASPAAQAPARELAFGLVSNIQYAPIFLGIERGTFLKHGLDLKIKQFSSGAEVTKALQIGEVGMGVAATQTVIIAKNQDIPFKGVAVIVGDATVAKVDDMISIMAHPNSGIGKIEDLAGRRVAAGAGTVTDEYLKAVLTKFKVPAEQVELVNVTIANTHPALIAAQVDAAVLQEPYGELALARLPAARLLIRGGGFTSIRVLTTAMETWLQQNRDLAERFALAYAEAAHYARTHLDEAGDAAARNLTGITPEVARKAVRHARFDPRSSRLVEESWNQENELLLAQKKTKRAVPLAEVFDPALTEKVLKEHPELFADLKPLP